MTITTAQWVSLASACSRLKQHTTGPIPSLDIPGSDDWQTLNRLQRICTEAAKATVYGERS